MIEEYLSQVGPVPFTSQFRFADEITTTLREHVDLTNIKLKIPGNSDPTFRPHRNSFELNGGLDTFQELQRIQIPSSDGGTAAIGWILHHSYKGAVPNASLKGLRLRSGNIQVGSNSILEDIFTEVRFNSWCVGEVHIIDPRIIPNGRRDHYEHNVHYTNLINQLSPIVRGISTRCRQTSIRRNWLRQFERQQDQVKRDLQVVKQGSLSPEERRLVVSQIRPVLDDMEKALTKDVLKPDAHVLAPALSRMRRAFAKVDQVNYRAKALAKLAPVQRRAYERVFAMLYECSSDKGSTKLLIDCMLARFSRNQRKLPNLNRK